MTEHRADEDSTHRSPGLTGSAPGSAFAPETGRSLESLLGPSRVRRRLTKLSERNPNFDPAELERADPACGWQVTDLCQPLPAEPPGRPAEHGSWQQAKRLMRGYEFADPSIVRAYYDPRLPLQGRNMLLKLQSLRIFHLYVGVRVNEVYERTVEREGRRAAVWGWNYRTLEGHVEAGQMDWQVWKWLDTGQVEFRVHAKSRMAKIANPLVRIAFRIRRGPERQAFLETTKLRMRRFVDLALEDPGVLDDATQTAPGGLTAMR